MSDSLKKFLLMFAVAGAVYWLLKPSSKPSTAPKSTGVTPTKDSALKAFQEYYTAYKKGESASSLDLLNQQLLTKYGVTIYQKASDKLWYAVDATGKEIAKASGGK